jgi:hypothetical protein
MVNIKQECNISWLINFFNILLSTKFVKQGLIMSEISKQKKDNMNYFIGVHFIRFFLTISLTTHSRLRTALQGQLKKYHKGGKEMR